MPKTKLVLKELIANLDSVPQYEQFLEKLRKSLRSLAEFYGFEPMATAPFEDVRVFYPLMKAGFFEERIPVICKMRTGSEVLLRPSGALGAVRAYTTHKLSELPSPLKVSFSGDSFFQAQKRDEKITSLKECGLVMIGEEGPVAEAEIIQVIWKSLGGIGMDMKNLQVRLNATGCQICRPYFRSAFGTYFRSRAQRLCKNCKRFFKRTPTKILVCEDEKCKIVSRSAPPVLDFLCALCKKHLKGLLEFLDEVSVPYFLDPKLFREGSWFNSFIFEVVAVKDLNELNKNGGDAGWVLAEGGLLSRAAEALSGKKLDVAAGVISLEAVYGLLSAESGLVGIEKPKVFLAHLGELAKRRGLFLLEGLRAGGIEVRESLGRDAIKSQLKVAERLEAEIALILGQKEALDNTIIVREVASGAQETIPQEKLVEFLKKKLKK
ncbi:MAG: ATP phosphoribosyltransferase regulatory subunit [Candidatus Sungiibacteriota bacterium]|uniref:histidine--tRNA ligase n=1 Tax=Candidatus Sungiibacteriota bacterium TaxID=2750080 RepID=A0A7T5RIX9_9BACT|nr:MAG: ATP phosphoribosyltransferase regulatory subunit [Candidatus Sungbacteria bacterium]